MVPDGSEWWLPSRVADPRKPSWVAQNRDVGLRLDDVAQ
jgi:hypothetical protein